MTLNSPNPDVEAMLDRPIWTALGSNHAHLAIDTGNIRRYRPGIVPFIALGDDDGALAVAVSLFGDTDQLLTAQRKPLQTLSGLKPVIQLNVVQMVALAAIPALIDERIVPLGEADLADMLELAALTKPGPFARGALDLGPFVGIRIDGRLAAMAGQRWSQPGFAEVSGICTHPDFQRRGLARLLTSHVAGEISARGERPYLHVLASNLSAIELYRSIGFEIRTDMFVAIYEKA